MARGFRAPTLGGGWRSVGREETRRPVDGPGEKRSGREGKGEERVEKIGNWSGSDDLSKSRERLISYVVAGSALQVVPPSLLACELARDSPAARASGAPEGGRLEKFNLPGTACEARHENPLSLTSSWLNSVFSYHLARKWSRPFVPRDPIARARGSDIVYDI